MKINLGLIFKFNVINYLHYIFVSCLSASTELKCWIFIVNLMINNRCPWKKNSNLEQTYIPNDMFSEVAEHYTQEMIISPLARTELVSEFMRFEEFNL